MAGHETAVASGLRSVAVAGDVSNSVIVTGDDVVVQLRVDGDDALLANLLTGTQMPQRALRHLPLEGLPPPSSDHVDRETEAQAVRSGVAQGRTFEVHGPAEIGKTFVVTYALAAHARTLPDGTVYVFAKGKPYGDVLQEVFEAFYACEPPCVTGEQQIRRDLAGRHALVVLDSIELPRDEIRQLALALQDCSLGLVARERPLGEGGRLMLEGLAPTDALVLVEQELRRPLAAAERAAAEQLCALLSGHPFQLRQAAADVRDGVRSFAALVRELSSPPALPAPPPGAAGDSPASAALAAQLFASLAQQEAAVVAQLAALRGASIGTEHIAALTEQPDVAGTLRGLEQRRLIASASPRYRIAGALHCLAQPDSRALDRAIAYFAGWARTHRSRPERVLTEAPALLELIRHAAADGRAADVVTLGRASDAAFAWGRRWDGWGAMLREVLDAAVQIGDRSAEAWARHQLGTRAYCLGDVSGAVGSLEAALHIREALGERSGAAATRYNLDFIAAPPTGGDRDDRSGNGGGGAGGRRAGGRSIPLLAALVVVVAGLGAAAAIGLSGGGDDPPPAPLRASDLSSTSVKPGTSTRQFTLSVRTGGSGEGTVLIDGKGCREPCLVKLDGGEVAILTPRAAGGSTFVRWTGQCDRHQVCRVKLTRPRSVTAIFDKGQPGPRCSDRNGDCGNGATDKPLSPAPPTKSTPPTESTPPTAPPPPTEPPPPPPYTTDPLGR